MVVLHPVLDITTYCIEVQNSTVETPGILKISLYLGFRLEHHDNLGTGVLQFVLGEHTSAMCKALKAFAEQHQVIAVGEGATPLDHTVSLIAPNGVTLPGTLPMSQSVHPNL